MTGNARDLVGGHATSTLRPDEQRQLYSAALEDQELFDTLVEEEALREALDDPATRRALIEALDTSAQHSWWHALSFRMALTAAALVLVTGLSVLLYRELRPRDSGSELARGPASRPGDSSPTPAAPVEREPAAEQTLAAWLPAAPPDPDSESAFRPAFGYEGASPMTKGPGEPSRHEFLPGREGTAAFFSITGDGPAVRIGDWVAVRPGQPLPVPPVPKGTDIRVVVVDPDVATDRDAEVVAAVEAGRGRVFVLHVERQD